jgi:DNA helicase IV
VEGNRELEAEQAHVDRAYERLDELRAHTEELLASVLDQGRGGTPQFREERDVIVRTSLARLEQLDVGEQALCFGRIDRLAGNGAQRDSAGPPTTTDPAAPASGTGKGIESFHIGRLGVSGEDLEPLVVDWRAPVAEPFYRATGRDPMGLVLRRHLAASGRRVLGIEDERFATSSVDQTSARTGEVLVGAGADGALGGGAGREDAPGEAVLELEVESEIGGPGALLAALGSARSGHMRDIVSTIQREQDEIIRAGLPGVLVVQGGPGTGKTAVALHRAAYLLYTHRFPLERQGVLVIGPNPLFLRYIEHVLPSLGESGVTLSTVSGLVHGLQVRAQERPAVARLKGEARMAQLVARAVRSRQRPLRHDAAVPYGATTLRLPADVSAAIVSAARRRPGTHNSRRRFVEQMVTRRLADDYLRALSVHNSSGSDKSAAFAQPVPERPDQIDDDPIGREAGRIDRIDREHGSAAPVLAGSPGFAHGADAQYPAPDAIDGSQRANANGHASGPDVDSDGDGDGAQPTFDFGEFSRRVRRVPELSEALDRMWPRLSAEELLHDLYGSRPLIALAAKGLLSSEEQATLRRPRSGALSEIPWTSPDLALIDEARVLLGPRKSRQENGTNEHDEGPRTYGHIVVDEAQDLSPMDLRMVSRRSLSGAVTAVGDIAQATGPWAPTSWEQVTAHLPTNRPARMTGLSVSYRTPAEVVEVAGRLLAEVAPGLEPPTPARRTGVPPRFEEVSPSDLARAVAQVASDLVGEVSPGTTAVLAPASLVADLAAALDASGVDSADPRREGLGAPLSLLPVDLANGLEFDAVVVVEPAAVVEEAAQGLRALYMALTRPTRRLAVVHSRLLPPALSG